MTNRFRYTQWDGSQEIDPLDPDELLDLLADDLLDEASLRQALDRLMMRGGMRQGGNRLQGLRDLLDRLRAQRDEQLVRIERVNLLAAIPLCVAEAIGHLGRIIGHWRTACGCAGIISLEFV